LKEKYIMRRFMTLLGVALLSYALLPAAAHAQVVYVQPARTYVAPVVVTPAYYYSPPSVTTYSSPTYSYYPSTTYSYYPPTTTVYSYTPSPAVVTYSAPAQVVVPATGVYTTRTYYGYGIFRPRGYYTETYYTPLR
jgi:hypothetical protein